MMYFLQIPFVLMIEMLNKIKWFILTQNINVFFFSIFEWTFSFQTKITFKKIGKEKKNWFSKIVTKCQLLDDLIIKLAFFSFIFQLIVKQKFLLKWWIICNTYLFLRINPESIKLKALAEINKSKWRKLNYSIFETNCVLISC